MAQQDRILRNKDLDQKTKLSRTTRWRLERAGKFPQRRSLTGRRAVGWLESEIDAWLESVQAA